MKIIINGIEIGEIVKVRKREYSYKTFYNPNIILGHYRTESDAIDACKEDCKNVYDKLKSFFGRS
jgi:hypothetical protein